MMSHKKREAAKTKIVAIVGQTGSGKSAWAVKLAKEFNGAVVSSDSRQVYNGLDVAAAKISQDEMQEVPHSLLGIIKLGEEFNVADYQRRAYREIDRIAKNQMLPIVAGGTGLYVDSVVHGYRFTDVVPDPALRETLAKWPLAKLQKYLAKLNPDTTVDMNNPRRVIRAIELAKAGVSKHPDRQPRYDAITIGISVLPTTLERRLRQRIKKLDFEKLFSEIRRLDKLAKPSGSPLSTWYKPVSEYLAGKTTRDQMLEAMLLADMQYAKRQSTWWKRDKSIHWVTKLPQAKSLIRQHLKRK